MLRLRDSFVIKFCYPHNKSNTGIQLNSPVSLTDCRQFQEKRRGDGNNKPAYTFKKEDTE